MMDFAAPHLNIAGPMTSIQSVKAQTILLVLIVKINASKFSI